jgi:uncharacterized membrane protein
MKPVLKFIKYKGAFILILLLGIVRGCHGLPEAMKVLFTFDKQHILDYNPQYSKHDMWVIHSGLWCFISCVILLLLIGSFLMSLRSNQNNQDETQIDET